MPTNYRQVFAICEICGNKFSKKTKKQRFCSKECKNIFLGNINRKHGFAHKENLYNIWKSMNGRCTNENDKRFKDYGGRGIKVCDEWKNNYESFRNWAIKNGYSDEKLQSGRNKLSIDRIDNNGNYCPENCRWTTSSIQANNTRNNIPQEIKNRICKVCGKPFKIHEITNIHKTCSRKCAFILRSTEHAEKTKDTYKKECPICKRIFEDRTGHFKTSKYCSKECSNIAQSPIWEYNGESHRVVEWAKIVNINAHCLFHRKNEMGWTIEETLTIPIGGKRNVKNKL